MSDYMKEAERLLNDFALLVQMNVAGLASMAQLAEARAALLAHIQRGAVPEGDDGKRVLREVFALCEDTETTCSDETGDFARGRRFEAKGIARAIGAWYQEEFCGRSHMGEPAAPAPDQFRDAAKMMAAEPERRIGPASDSDMAVYQSIADGYARDTALATAEVPMPDIKAHLLYCSAPKTAFRTVWKDGIDVEVPAHWVEHFCRRYGDAREAAGYARGLKAAERDCVPSFEMVQAYLVALNAEARRRGAMFPQTIDEQDADDSAIHRVTGMVEWYGGRSQPTRDAVLKTLARRSATALRGEVK